MKLRRMSSEKDEYMREFAVSKCFFPRQSLSLPCEGLEKPSN